jgi:hypothetical protein
MIFILHLALHWEGSKSVELYIPWDGLGHCGRAFGHIRGVQVKGMMHGCVCDR